jgi:hypothetical protein
MFRSTAIVFKAWAAAFYGSTTLLGIGIGTTIGQEHNGTLCRSRPTFSFVR